MPTERPLGAHLYGEKVMEIVKTPTDSRRLGVFEGYLSTWTVDRDNERFSRGAFQQSIVEWLSAGDAPPILHSHDRKDPENVVGVIETMHEDDEGLRVTGRLNLRSARAQRVYEAMLGGALRSMSVGFIAHEWTYEKSVRVFTRAEILEASLTPVPSNPRARVLAIKALDDSRGEVAESTAASTNSQRRL